MQIIGTQAFTSLELKKANSHSICSINQTSRIQLYRLCRLPVQQEVHPHLVCMNTKALASSRRYREV